MIDFFTWATPNGQKISIFLEEAGLPYREHGINIMAGDQFKPEFLAISPNNRIPAIIDQDGPDGQPISVFESGAILIYLAEKTGRFLSKDLRARTTTLEWLMWQMGGFGPMLGQAHHFNVYAPERIAYGMERYTNEAKRLYGVLDRRLANHEFVAGAHYSIADMAIWPWTAPRKMQRIELSDYPHVERWVEQLKERPAIKNSFERMKSIANQLQMDASAWQNLFGKGQVEQKAQV